MRIVIALSILSLSLACTGKKEFKAGTQTASAKKEIPPPAPTPNIETPPKPVDNNVVAAPSVPVEKFGINFEDTEGGDGDYNDAVLCFRGKFAVQGSDIVSREDQQIAAETFSASGCQHSIEIKVTHAGGKTDIKILDASNKEKGDLALKKGDAFEVLMTTTSDQCKPAEKRSMKDEKFAKILKDVCNDTGM